MKIKVLLLSIVFCTWRCSVNEFKGKDDTSSVIIQDQQSTDVISTGDSTDGDLITLEEIEGGIPNGHFDLDTSTQIYPFNQGSTDGHVHEYDDKYNRNGADFLDLKDNKLSSLNQVIAPETKFRIFVVNAELSPLGNLRINGTQWQVSAFQSQFNGQNIYSLGAVAGAIKIDSFQLSFPQNTFKENGLVSTATGCVRSNTPGKSGEYRNGALLIQVVDADNYAFDQDTGLLSEGLIWEASLFWHRDSDCYI